MEWKENDLELPSLSFISLHVSSAGDTIIIKHGQNKFATHLSGFI